MNQLEAIEARLKEIRDGRATFDGIRGTVLPPSDDPDLAALLAVVRAAAEAVDAWETNTDMFNIRSMSALAEALAPLLKEVDGNG